MDRLIVLIILAPNIIVKGNIPFGNMPFGEPKKEKGELDIDFDTRLNKVKMISAAIALMDPMKKRGAVFNINDDGTPCTVGMLEVEGSKNYFRMLNASPEQALEFVKASLAEIGGEVIEVIM